MLVVVAKYHDLLDDNLSLEALVNDMEEAREFSGLIRHDFSPKSPRTTKDNEVLDSIKVYNLNFMEELAI